MVTMLGVSPVVPEDPNVKRLMEGLSASQKKQLDDIGKASMGMLAPLLVVNSRDELTQLVSQLTGTFLRLKAETLQVLASGSIDPQFIADFFNSSFDMVVGVLKTKADRLGQDNLELLLSILESAQTLFMQSIELLKQSVSKILQHQVLLLRVGPPVVSADVCMSALLLAAFDENSRWTPAAITLLVHTADDYFTEVEDAFLSEYAPLLSTDEEDPVDYHVLKAALGV
ncbi:MAG: hypothetical protein FJ316_11215 [SAR202 cluster bacterium]|nr:hypothetical protein [SAR202 cluster bacterium]